MSAKESEDEPLPLHQEHIQKPLSDTGSHTTSTDLAATPTQLKPKKRSLSFSFGILPGFRKLDWIDSTSQTQAMTRLAATTSASTATPSLTSPTSIKQRGRALTATSTITSLPQPSFLTDPQVKIPVATPIPVSLQHSNANTSLTPRQRQNSASNFNLNPTTTTTIQNPITSPRNSPPLDFLLDDDPFANLTGGPVGSGGGWQPCIKDVKGFTSFAFG